MIEHSFRTRSLREACALPVLIEPVTSNVAITDATAFVKDIADRQLRLSGGLLFRGFDLTASQTAFHDFVAGFGHPLLAYDFASTPRSHVSDGIYTSTEYPASQHIPLHNEQSYTREWAMKLWFHCIKPAETGGETPIADSRDIYRRISSKIRDRFTEKGLMYVRNYGNGLDLPWQKVFDTFDRRAVEAYCDSRGIHCEWKPDGELRTKQISQAIECHPVTGEYVWFNQAHLFHVSGLEPNIRAALLDAVDREDLPRNVYYGDGEEIELDALEEIRTILRDTAIPICWQAGDVLLIDNMLTAHGRTPFTGKRRMVVAMTELHSNLERSSRARSAS